MMTKTITLSLMAFLSIACAMRGQTFDTQSRDHTVTRKLCFQETGGTDRQCFESPALAAPLNFTLPDDDNPGALCSDGSGALSWGSCAGLFPLRAPNSGIISWKDSTDVDRTLLQAIDGQFIIGHTVAPFSGGNTFIFSAVDTTLAGVQLEARSDDVMIFRPVPASICAGCTQRGFLGDNNQPWEAFIGIGVNLLSTASAPAQLLIADRDGADADTFVTILGAPNDDWGSYALSLPAAPPSVGQSLIVSAFTGGVYQLAFGSPASPFPVIDTTSIVHGSGDSTKQIRFEVDGLSAFTTRVLTPQDASYTLAGTNITNLFTTAQHIANGSPLRWLDGGGTARNILFSSNGNVALGHQVAPAAGGNTSIFSTVGAVLAGMMLEARGDGVQVWRRVAGTAARAFLGDNNLPWEAYIGYGANLLSNPGAGYVSQLLLEDHDGNDKFVALLGPAVGSGSSYAMHLPVDQPAIGQSLSVGAGGSGTWELGWLTPVTTNTTQTISGAKTFSVGATFNGGISAGTGTNSTLHVGTGNFYNRYIGASSGVSCAAIAAGWSAITSDNYVVWCDGSGGRFRAAGSSY
jgi:hypothetical protein